MLWFSVPSGAPGGVRVTSFEYVPDLLVEWNPLPQYDVNGKLLGYTVYYMEFVSFQLESVNTSNLHATKVTLKGLKPAHEYYVAVAAFTSKGEGPLSSSQYATTGTFANYCFCPLILCLFIVRYSSYM